MPQLPVKDFSKSKPLIGSLDLNETQIKSYKWFVEKGLRELFDEISPITDHTGAELELHFDEYHFDEPKHDEATSRYKDVSFETPLRVMLRLENKKDGTTKTQEVYFGDFPTMTDRGTFIINGVERVVISQLVRSAGAYFTEAMHRGRKFFGAKIIPNRGAWLEFETDLDGSIGVKIDRHRKVPVTALLRIFGLDTNDKILEAVGDIDKGQVRYMEATLAKDDAKDAESSYVEIYRHLRPGDPAAPAAAKSLIDAMFLRNDRYDLSAVGRFKMNQRLGLKKENRLLGADDLVAIIREIIALNNTPDASGDDIDHLGNRRVKAVGELIEGRLRIAFARLRRIVQDRMSTQERENLLPGQLVSFRPITAILNDFFASSQLSQFMDQVNPLAELEHKRRVSALGPGGLTRERASFEVRDVHRSHYGRICPIQTPEGANIGLINYLANYARVDDFGFIETPYAKVEKGCVTKEIVWLNALQEEKHKITHAGVARTEDGTITEKNVEARIYGEPGTCSVGEIDLIDVAPHQFVSVSTSLIPFLQHDDANRALMGSNMQRQAVVTIRPEVPYVGTGQEEPAARDSAYIVMAEDDGKVIESDAMHIAVKYNKKGNKTYTLEKFKRSNQFTAISQRPVVVPGQTVKKGDVLADGPAIDHGVLGLGKNLLVAFMSWEGGNFEDAVILSERVRRDDFFTSIHIEDFECDVRDTKLGPEMTTPDIPNVSEDKLRNLDEEGIVRVGAEVKAGDILVGKISPKGESELSSEERLLRAIFGEKARDVKDTSLTLSHGKRGRIVNIKVFEREKGDKLEPGIIKRIQVEVAVLRKIQAGDKMAGRHGNKGVISQVRPMEDMPYLEDGTPVDVVLNPLGVASRMNLGQILETHLGLAAKKLGYRAVTPSLDSATEEEIRAELKKAELPEDSKVTLFDGRTGRPFDGKVMVGVIYMMKLNHLVEDKAHARSIGPYSLITQQPLGGKAQFGGQRFGEMEVWALEGYGAKYTLQEMLTIKSDDVLGRAAAYESIIRGEPIKEPNIPAAFNVLVSELKSLGLNIEPVYDSETDRRDNFSGLKIELASPDEIMKWSHGEITKPETINYRTQRPEKDGLFSERIFGPTRDFECYCGKYRKVRYKGVICDKCGVEVTHSSVRRERMGHITLAAPVAHIWFVKSVPSRLGMTLDISSQKLEQVIYYSAYIVTEVDEAAKKRALEELQKELKSKEKAAPGKAEKSELQAAAAGVKETISELRVGKTLSEGEYFSLSRKFGDVFHAATGAEAVRKILEKLDLKKEIHNLERDLEHTKDPTTRTKDLRRLKMLKSMHLNHVRPEWMITTTLPVLPPDLRPMVALDGGRYATSDLNDLYRRVINRNNRLKKLLDIKAPDIIVRNEKRMLQEAVDALIDNSARFGTQQLSAQRRPLRSLADMLKGKQGRFRQNLLGKRVDYSGRSVIVVGPKLNINQCGLPKRMALELFRPFVVSEVIRRGLAHNIRSAGRLIEQGVDEVWAILEEVIQNRRVLLNRAPTLHRLSIQAFRPILTEGLAIQLPPLVTTAFNADFDGDQMAVHLPLSEDAQREAGELMASERNLLKPATGDLIALPTQDAVLGTYYLTRDMSEEYTGRKWAFVSNDEALLALDAGAVTLHTPIYVNGITTTAGRLIFNEALEGNVAYVNEPVNKKKLGKIIDEIVVRHGVEVTQGILDRVKLLGFEMATISGITWSVGDMVVPPGKADIMAAAEVQVEAVREQFGEGFLTEAERRARIIRVWEKAKEDIAKLVATVLPKSNPIYQIVDSGSRGSWAQPVQMMGIKGVVVNPKNEKIELPIKASYKEGLSVLEYFISTHGARKGTTDTALKTSQAGYLTRRLVDVSQGVVIREPDCGTKDGIELLRSDAKEFQQSFAGRIFSRNALHDIKDGRKILVREGETITKAMARAIDEAGIEAIMVRSPINCKTLYGICSKCYGYDLGRNWDARMGDAVGVVAAQSIGEPGTQLTLRTFHSGGVAGLDITHGLPRVEELFEARPPKGQALLSHEEGTVVEIKESGATKIISVKTGPKKADVKDYSLPRSVMLLVKIGDKVKNGDQLSEGNLNLHELLSLRGPEAVHKYIINEVQKIYLSEGTLINDKHIEVIVRQMFSRVRLKDAGDAPDFVMGEIVEKSKFLEVNRELRRDKKTPAKAEQLLLGITRVALTTESVLSAASFQDTARVLVRAALEAKIDRLLGLKENVIIGRLVPLGEGSEKRERPAVDESQESEAMPTSATK